MGATMTGDDDHTPREYAEYAVTDGERRRHFASYPPGTPALRDRVIAPRDAFEQQLEQRVEELERMVSSLDGSRRFWRWAAGLGIPALLSAAFVLLLYGADKISASAERVGEQRAEIRALQEEVHNLRLKIDKLAGVDLKAVTIVQAR